VAERASLNPSGTEVLGSRRSGLRAVDGLLTGRHEPESSHLDMLEAAPAAS